MPPRVFASTRAAVCFGLVCLLQTGMFAAVTRVGVARVNVTPDEPIRLTGYAVRQSPSEGIEQKLWAKALALEDDSGGQALLLTLDICGVSEGLYRELIRRLAASASLRQDQVALACSHTHSGPCTTDWAPNIFAQDIPPEQQAAIDRYTRGLLDKLETVAKEALENRRPGRLSRVEGSVDFARNRRTSGGPVDHALPVLVAWNAEGEPKAVVANYACHCTTIGGGFNRHCGDWAGYAQEAIERDHPGAMAFITIGCGADANPHPRGGEDHGLALARQHGTALAGEVRGLLTKRGAELRGRLETEARELNLPFAPHFTRAQWEERSQQDGIVGYHARKNLGRLDRGEMLPETLYYPIVTWRFGDDLTMAFLPGEVVVDYALRLKQELSSQRLWITAYANYVPCYIPSRRILAEGGYEAETSLWYYDRPARLDPAVEDLIVGAVRALAGD